MQFNTTLHKLGFSPIEASVFIILCKNGALTGYEVAKLSGISRSNVYAALRTLQDKGKCTVSEGESTKYTAISKEELLLSTKREMEATLLELEQNFPEMQPTNEPYVTIRGYDNVLSKIKNHILLCTSHLYIMTTSPYIELLQEELSTISETKRVTIICEKELQLGEHIITYRQQKPVSGFHMIMDTVSVITGDLEAERSQCLYSTNASLVRLMRESFITALDMITLQNH